MLGSDAGDRCVEGRMIRQRTFGSDTDFMAWLRSQEKDLPSSSSDCGFVATDNDAHVHRYKTAVDKMGTREIQCLMFLEVKTRGGDVPQSQLDTFVKLHHFIGRRRSKFNKQALLHYGVSFIFLSGTDPENSEVITWGRFERRKGREYEIVRTKITKEQLLQLLRFDLDPDTLSPQPFRRHHKTQYVVRRVKAELGFEYDQIVVKRS